MPRSRWRSNSQDQTSRRHDPCPLALRGRTPGDEERGEGEGEDDFLFVSDIPRINPARLRRGYLIPDEPLYVWK